MSSITSIGAVDASALPSIKASTNNDKNGEHTLPSSDWPEELVEAPSPFRDWPNDIGFQTNHEQRGTTELLVTGTIPSYAAGTLYRTGPAGYKIKGTPKGAYSFSHWFDGYGQTYRFQLIPTSDGRTKVLYNSRCQVDELIDSIRRTGDISCYTFAQKRDPCLGLFGKAMSVFKPITPYTAENLNVSVTLHANREGTKEAENLSNAHAPRIKALFLRTDVTYVKEINPETLEPIGLAEQTDLHPLLKGPFSCAHAQSDPTTGDVYNYNLEFSGRYPTYRVFCVSAITGETTIIATISGPGIAPAYVHSFFLTEDFVILCIWNSHIPFNGLSVLYHKNILDAISPFDPSKPTKWLVIDRKHNHGQVAEFESPASFAFHTINATQHSNPNGTASIVCDLIDYPDLSILHKFYYQNLLSTSPDVPKFEFEKGVSCASRLARFRIPNITNSPTFSRLKVKAFPSAILEFSIPSPLIGDIPTINPSYFTKPYRYVYSIVNRKLSSFLDGLSKLDLETGKAIYWDNPKGHTPGEAIFVADPKGSGEDDGVVLSVVLDGFEGKSYLVVLDARTMREVGRAKVGAPVGLGFHGAHFGNGV